MRREACFACTTPYQVLSSIAVQLEKKLDADLYVFGMFENYQAMSERIKSYGLFANVIPVDCSEIGAPTEKQAAIQMLRPRKFTKVFLDDAISYNWFYTSSRAHPKLLLLHEIERRNKNLRIVLIEDGLGTYSPISTQLNTKSLKRRLFNQLLGWGEVFKPERTSVMARRPDLIELPALLKTVPVLEMPELPTDEKTSNMLFDLFSVDLKDAIKERVIVFDTVRGLKDVGVQFDRVDACYQLLLETFGSQNVICKPHPRSRKTTSVNLKLFEKTEMPIEVLYSEMNDLEDRCLVGICSTAMYSPKLVFGKEPYVIDLSKLVFKNGERVYSELSDKMCSLYNDKKKVFCPSTMEEFAECMKTLT